MITSIAWSCFCCPKYDHVMLAHSLLCLPLVAIKAINPSSTVCCPAKLIYGVGQALVGKDGYSHCLFVVPNVGSRSTVSKVFLTVVPYHSLVTSAHCIIAQSMYSSRSECLGLRTRSCQPEVVLCSIEIS